MSNELEQAIREANELTEKLNAATARAKELAAENLRRAKETAASLGLIATDRPRKNGSGRWARSPEFRARMAEIQRASWAKRRGTNGSAAVQ